MKMNNSEIKQLFERQTEYQLSFVNSSSKERKKILKSLKQNLIAYETKLCAALKHDLNKHPFESYATEFFLLHTEINHVLKHLDDWMQPKFWSRLMSNPFSKSVTRVHGKGNSLILSPWNYPVQLTLAPLISCIAAGNTAILKPSEFTPETTRVLSELIANTFPKELVSLIPGDSQIAEQLTALPFNHIFFTGSPKIGKKVMAAASQNLSSVTLELGGKSPVIIDENASIKQAAKRIIWGKYTNAGQTCIAPDYVLIPENKKNEFAELIVEEWRNTYTLNNELNEDCCVKIISEPHFNRLEQLKEDAVQKGASIIYEGPKNDSKRMMGFCLIENCTASMQIDNEEIFGPILPLYTYKSKEEAVEFIRSRQKPLALYIFSQSRKNQKFFSRNCQAGGITFNDVFMHISDVRMPFGGINNSGIGYSHGYHGFLEFSHITSEVHSSAIFSSSSLIYPPYSKKKLIS
ncbi:MAG: aldehyde dehydrogenase family protein, partial [Bacteroidota bacterium]